MAKRKPNAPMRYLKKKGAMLYGDARHGSNLFRQDKSVQSNIMSSSDQIPIYAKRPEAHRYFSAFEKIAVAKGYHSVKGTSINLRNRPRLIKTKRDEAFRMNLAIAK